jgi:hypothetical protein
LTKISGSSSGGAFFRSQGWFWAKHLQANQHLTLLFQKEVPIKAILVDLRQFFSAEPVAKFAEFQLSKSHKDRTVNSD